MSVLDKDVFEIGWTRWLGSGLGSAAEGVSCHTSCNPPSPALKTVTLSLNPRSLLPRQPHRRTRKSDTPPISPYPSSPQLFVMARRGLFRGKLTMSGISGVTGKMKPEVFAQRKGWSDGEGYSHWSYKRTDWHSNSSHSDQCIKRWKRLGVLTTIRLSFLAGPFEDHTDMHTRCGVCEGLSWVGLFQLMNANKPTLSSCFKTVKDREKSNTMKRNRLECWKAAFEQDLLEGFTGFRCENVLMHERGRISVGVWIVVLEECMWIWTECADIGQATTRGRTGKDRLFVLMHITAAKTHILLSQPWLCLSCCSYNMGPGLKSLLNVLQHNLRLQKWTLFHSLLRLQQTLEAFFIFLFSFSKSRYVSQPVSQQVWDVMQHGQRERFKVLTPDPQGSVCGTGIKTGLERIHNSGLSQHSWRFAPNCSRVLPSCLHLSTSVSAAPADVFWGLRAEQQHYYVFLINFTHIRAFFWYNPMHMWAPKHTPNTLLMITLGSVNKRRVI